MNTIFNIKTEEEYLKNKDQILINELNTSGNNALYYASFEQAKWLIKHGCNINNKNISEQNALFSEYIDNSTLKFLIESGIETNVRDRAGKTPLFYLQNIIDRNINEALERIDILVKNGVNVNALDNDSQNVLFYFNTAAVIVQRLIEHNININCLDNFNKNALFFANENVMKILVQHNINYSVIDNSGSNALFYSASSITEQGMIEDFKGVDFLIQNTDIDPFLCNKNGEIALSYLPNESILYLIEKGILKGNQIINDRKHNLLFQSERIELVDKLLYSGVDINQKDNKGDTAIFWNSFDMIEKLINAGIDINATNDLGNNALFRFISRGCRNEEDEKIAELLILRGIDYKIYPSIPVNLRNFVAEAERNELDKSISVNNKPQIVKRI